MVSAIVEWQLQMWLPIKDKVKGGAAGAFDSP
jgi:hypothetical protein